VFDSDDLMALAKLVFILRIVIFLENVPRDSEDNETESDD
jgi:hypothetical protein